MTFEVTSGLTDSDALLFREWFEVEIAPRYPLSTRATAEWLLDIAGSPGDSFGYFTLRKAIWKVTSESGVTLGFTVATEKRGGSVKFGPTLVRPSHRGRGVGRLLRSRVEDHYRSAGFRKAYSTTNLRNGAGIFYLIGIGYGIEAHLKDHYQNRVDEVVLGKILSRKRQTPVALVERKSSILLQRLAPSYDGLDDTFEANLFKCAVDSPQLGDEAAYTRKQKVLFGSPAGNFCVTTPKREGAIKIGPILSDDPDGLRGLLGEVEAYYRRLCARKLYCLVPVQESLQYKEMRNLGWDLEGLLREPYRPCCDMAILSRFLKNGQH